MEESPRGVFVLFWCRLLPELTSKTKGPSIELIPPEEPSQLPLDTDHDEERDPLSSELIGQAEDRRELMDAVATNRENHLDDSKHL